MSARKRALSSPKSSRVERPEIYRYHDYREFLKAWFAYRKASQRGFSLRSLAQLADLAVGYLPMVLAGTRPLSSKAMMKLGPHLGLAQTERSYFELLVVLGTTDSQSVRLETLDRMKRFGAYQKHNPKETEVYQYLRHWYYVAIREMASLPEFKMNPEWIQSQLRVQVPLGEIKEALEFLVENKYIEVDSNGQVRPPEKDLECLGGVYRVALTQFHDEMLSLATQSIGSTASNERKILGHTFALSQKDYEKAQAILDEALQQVRALGEGQKDSDSVYHLELALFPLTRSSKK